jgi:hypothetical protein
MCWLLQADGWRTWYVRGSKASKEAREVCQGPDQSDPRVPVTHIPAHQGAHISGSTKAFKRPFQGTSCLMYIAAISSGRGRSLRSRGLLSFVLTMAPQKAWYGPKVIKGQWFEAATPACACGIGCAVPLRSCIPSFVRRSVLFGKLRRALLLLLALSGTGGVARPSRPGLLAQCRTAWAPRVFLRQSN